MILYYFVEFAGSFANIALLLLFIGRLFPKKEPVSKWFYVYVVLMIAGQCALSLFPDWVTQRTIYLLVGGFFLALLFYEVRPWQAVFASGAFFTLIALVEVLAMLLIGLRIPDTDILMQAGAARLVYVVFSNLIQVPLVVLISHFFSRKGNALRILWLLPIIAIQIASIAVCYVAQYHAADEYFPDYMVGLMAVLLLINILIVFYVEALRENELEKFKAKFNEQQYNLQMEYYQQLKERQEEVRSLRHDVKKYILAMQAVAEHGDTEELHKIAQAATDIFERSTNVSAVGNPVVDGRKIGLDQRLMNSALPDDPNSKLNACVNNVLRIWNDTKEQKLTQLIFCDMSTPKGDGSFNVYDDIRTKLLNASVPEQEIEFIHNADTENKKAELFSKVRSGQVRVLLGSTAKMGAGTNVQTLLVAVHHLDVGWKPSDMTQRNGRIIRQGNMNKEVKVFNYVTEGTFDSYLFVRHEVA